MQQSACYGLIGAVVLSFGNIWIQCNTALVVNAFERDYLIAVKWPTNTKKKNLRIVDKRLERA